jgi:hypothetical protein
MLPQTDIQSIRIATLRVCEDVLLAMCKLTDCKYARYCQEKSPISYAVKCRCTKERSPFSCAICDLYEQGTIEDWAKTDWIKEVPCQGDDE